MMKKLKLDILASLKNKKINVFVLFLALSFIILLFTKLSKEYTNTIAFDIEKINVPKENIILNDSLVLNITLKTHGFKWLTYYFSKPKIKIDFSKDVYEKDAVYVWHKTSAYLENTQFNKQVELLNITPDTLFFRYGVHMVKKVPVKLISDLKFNLGYDVSGDIILEPDSVVVIGPESVVKNIHKIETTKASFADIKSDISETIKLKQPENSKDITISNSKVLLKAKVEKFTEGTLKIPVTIINEPENLKINYFPKELNVSYYVSLSNFNDITASNFKVVCDYNKLGSNQSFLIPEVVKYPEAVKNVKLNYNRVEFIINE